jgi:leucyl aminopeptidase
MEIKTALSRFQDVESDALAVMIFEGEKPDQGLLKELDDSSGGIVSEVISTGEMRGKLGDLVYIHRPGRIAARRLLLLGAGNRQNLAQDAVSKCAGTAARFLRGKGARNFAFVLRSPFEPGSGAQRAVEGVTLGLFEPDTYKTRDKEERRIDGLIIVAERGPEADLAAGIKRGAIIAEAMNLARGLANEPSSTLTPSELAERARANAAPLGLEVDILDEERMAGLGMGALLGVARGSEEPPKLIVLTYTPQTTQPGSGELVAVVGKGITFDSGGISIKPTAGMDQMKYDMSGAAHTLAIMCAVAQLKPNVRIVGLMPTCENMPSGHAYKPGDVLRSMNGKTIEIISTDAEGRLILADAITYARKLGATRIIDIATLTGAVLVALAGVNTGLFGNNQQFISEIRQSGGEVGEKLWPLPMDSEYRELLKSDIADFKNSGGRYGGASIAALFLSEFAENTPWIHLDIAATAWESDRKPHVAKGPTGACIRTIVNYLCNHVGQSAS